MVQSEFLQFRILFNLHLEFPFSTKVWIKLNVSQEDVQWCVLWCLLNLRSPNMDLRNLTTTALRCLGISSTRMKREKLWNKKARQAQFSTRAAQFQMWNQSLSIRTTELMSIYSTLILLRVSRLNFPTSPFLLASQRRLISESRLKSSLTKTD